MATNTSALKTFAQQTRAKLVSLISTKMHFVLNGDTAELRGYEQQISKLRNEIAAKTEKVVIEEVAYTWFNRVMALRFMDANEYNAPKVVTPAQGQMRPEILQEAMAGNVDESLLLSPEDLILPEEKLYRKILVATCNNQMSQPMPFLFEHITDYTELLLPDDLLSEQSFVTDIRKGMTDEDCQNVELMGWLYQFYITDRKAEAEAKKSKKGGLKSDEQAAATQLFTPHWVVRYMVENSLGRIWMTLHPDSRLIDDMPYYIKPIKGQTDVIPEDIHSVQDIRFIDPCMGSGHVLVYAFDLFCKMYEEEGQMHKDIPTLILQNNIYGMDIDRRCYQLASFALTMKARAYYNRYLRRTVNPNVIALQNIDHDTIDASGAWGQKSLMWQFENIDTIGSLLKVTAEDCAAIRVDSGLFGINQQILKTQAEYLSRKYHVVVTNPPYLGKGFSPALKSYLEKQYPNTKYDIMATFMERSIQYCVDNGKMSMINMHSWMFIASFERFRSDFLTHYQIDSMLHLGTHAFDEISGEVVQSTSFVFAKHNPSEGIYYRLVDGENCAAKENLFLQKSNEYKHVNQNKFQILPGTPLGYWIGTKWFDLFKSLCIKNHVSAKAGVVTGNDPYFIRNWFEINENDIVYTSPQDDIYGKYHLFQKGGSPRRYYGNRDFVIKLNDFWNEDYYNVSIRRGDKDAYFGKAIGWSQVGNYSIKSFRLIDNSVCGTATPTLYCNSDSNFNYILGFVNTKIAPILLDLFNPTINLLTTDVCNLPLIEDDDQKDIISSVVNANINISKHDWDSHEISWDFKTNELYRLALGLTYDQVQSSLMTEAGLNLSLEEAVSRYTQFWQEKFMQLHANEEELNRQFIEIYGLQDELTPDVPLDEITILQKGEISIEEGQIVWHKEVIIKQFISWLAGCFMGRYSVDKPGLIIASQGQKVEDLDLPAQTLEIDDDGIIPIVQEADFFVDDMTQRIEAALRTLFGEDHFYENMKYIKACFGQELREYLYKDYYNDHLQMYSVKGAKRPIYWLFSSRMGDKKKKGYFKALVYMHRIEADTLSKLHADYVHPYLQKIEQQQLEAEDQAARDDLSQAQRNKALKLADLMKDKVREVKAFETQLVEMASHRLSIDLDDGVKANYPKFYPLVEPIKGLEASED